MLYIKQLCCTPKKFLLRNISSKAPRVRFICSSKGYLHLGKLRTALNNYLLGKSHGGVFILRIEDINQSKVLDGDIEATIEGLNWAGLDYDEGPHKGEYGPYLQSERLNIYKNEIEKLLKNGSAYRCFCSEKRLNTIREEAVSNHIYRIYDNRCRDLKEEHIIRNLETNKPYCIRLKLTSHSESFNDMIYGKTTCNVSLNEGDPILLKHDGYPTLAFANVVDDHLMRITHILKGVEWKSSTLQELLIYRAFQWSPPELGHLPPLVNQDGSNLQNIMCNLSIENFFKRGIYPQALINYITLIDGGYEPEMGKFQIRTLKELSEQFQISNLSTSPVSINPYLLDSCNKLEIKRRLKDEKLSKQLYFDLQNIIKMKYPHQNLNLCEEHIMNILERGKHQVSVIQDLALPKFGYLWIRPKDKLPNLNRKLVNKLINNLESLETFDEKSLHDFMVEFSSVNKLKLRDLMTMVRRILCRLLEAPNPIEMMNILGKNETLLRIRIQVQ